MELFNPHSNEWLINKYKYYDILRDKSELWWSSKYQLYPITRYSDVIYALHTPEMFSSSNGNLINEFPRRIGKTLASTDNPRHDELKNLIKDAYSKQNIDRVSTSVANISENIFKDLQDLSLSEICLHISSWLSIEILNIQYDRKVLHNLLLDMLKHSDKSISSKYYTTNEDSSIVFSSILRQLLINKVPAEGEGVYSEYLKNCDLETHGLFFFTAAIYPGGTSTAGALQFLLYDLFTNDNARSSIINNNDLIRPAVLESLRYNTATSRFLRTTMQDIEVQGTPIPKGTRVALCLDSANRDPRQWQNPSVFDINRNTSKALSFGYGIHTCIAQAITRETLIKVLAKFLKNYPNYKITPEKDKFMYLMTAPGNFDFVTNLKLIRL